MVARAEAHENQRLTPVVEVDGIGLLHERGTVEHRADERDVRRERHVGLELARRRDEIERAAIVDVRDRVDRRQSELGADRRDGGERGRQHLDEGSGAEQRERGVEERDGGDVRPLRPRTTRR